MTLDDFRTQHRIDGHFSCRLNSAETNEWYRFITAHDAFQALCIACANRDRAIYGNGDVQSSVVAVIAADRMVHEVAMDWYARNILPRLEAEEKRD